MGRLASGEILCVLNDAHNLEIARMAFVSDPEMPAYGILLREEFAGKCLIDHSDLLRRRRIFSIDGTSAQQSSADSLEIMRADAVIRSVVAFSGRPAFDVNDVIPVVTPHGTVKRVTGAEHAGNARKLILKLLIESIELIRFISGQRRVYPDDQPSVWIEAEILILDVSQAFSQQACANEQRDGKSNLQKHQRPLRHRRVIERGASRPVQSVSGLGVRCHPRRRRSEQDTRGQGN